MKVSEKFFPAQRTAILRCKDILTRYNGAVLCGEEGTGKTPMVAQIIEDMDKVLYVCPAKSLDGIKGQMQDYDLFWNIDTGSIDYMSYDGFANAVKLPAKKVSLIDI